MNRQNYDRTYCTFYIVRHGETDWNVRNIIQGQNNKPNLTKKGVNQTKKLANQFKKINFAAIFSSDLLRSKKTAQIIALEKRIIVKTTKLLRERLFGRFEGKLQSSMRQELKEQLKKKEMLEERERVRFRLTEGIETDEELLSRFINFLRATAIAYPNKKILVVTHGGVMRIFLIHLGYAKYQQLPSGSISNSGYFILKSDCIDFFLIKTSGINRCQDHSTS